MAANIKMTVAYDGTRYLGWQKTKMGPSIEEELEKALRKIVQEPVALQAASRTDAGVHAEGQIVNFLLHKPCRDKMRLLLSINALLPKDIAVTSIEEALQNFHPTIDTVAKQYRYNLCYAPFQLPLNRFSYWHYPYPLDLLAMEEAAKHFIGEMDFSSFCNTKNKESYLHKTREVYAIDICKEGDHRLAIYIKGNHFLYKMVRNIVGTLAAVGRGKRRPEEIPGLLLGRDRTLADITAPAHGLCLLHVFY